MNSFKYKKQKFYQYHPTGRLVKGKKMTGSVLIFLKVTKILATALCMSKSQYLKDFIRVLRQTLNDANRPIPLYIQPTKPKVAAALPGQPCNGSQLPTCFSSTGRETRRSFTVPASLSVSMPAMKSDKLGSYHGHQPL